MTNFLCLFVSCESQAVSLEERQNRAEIVVEISSMSSSCFSVQIKNKNYKKLLLGC